MIAEGLERAQRLEFGEPGVSGLFSGFAQELGPFCLFILGTAFDVMGYEGLYGLAAEFDRAFEDSFKGLGFWKTENEVDGGIRTGNGGSVEDPEAGLPGIRTFKDCGENGSPAVQGEEFVAGTGPEHSDEVVAFSLGEEEKSFLLAGTGIEKGTEARHGKNCAAFPNEYPTKNRPGFPGRQLNNLTNYKLD